MSEKQITEEELVLFLEKMGKQRRIQTFGHDLLTEEEKQVAKMMISKEKFPPMTSEEKERALKVLEKGFKKIEKDKKNKK